MITAISEGTYLDFFIETSARAQSYARNITQKKINTRKNSIKINLI